MSYTAHLIQRKLQRLDERNQLAFRSRGRLVVSRPKNYIQLTLRQVALVVRELERGNPSSESIVSRPPAPAAQDKE
jgi:hypothetical protein